MKHLLLIAVALVLNVYAVAQSAEELVKKIRAKLEKVDDYAADARLKTNVVFIKAPIADVKIFFKKPDRMRIINKNGIFFIPKRSMNINLSNIFVNTRDFDIIDAGKEEATGLRVIKLFPKVDISGGVFYI